MRQHRFSRLLFGTAGIPISCTGNTIDGITTVRELGLDTMELEFVHSVNITKEKAPLVREAATKNNVLLTCHAPYYINLNSPDEEKRHASMQRILSSARILDACGGYSTCFHAGFYQAAEKQAVFERIAAAIHEIVRLLQDESVNVWVRPEVSGKPSAFGSLDELIALSSSLEGVLPCIDFAHLHARTNGKNNTKEEFEAVLNALESGIGKEVLHQMHVHISGIAYNEKGERHHLTLGQSDMNYRSLLATLKGYGVRGVVICESPNIEQDALLMQRTHEQA